MRRGTDPKAVFAMVIVVIAAIILAFIVSSILPEVFAKWKSLVFWGTVAAGAGIGTVICGRFLNRK